LYKKKRANKIYSDNCHDNILLLLFLTLFENKFSLNAVYYYCKKLYED